MTVTVDEALKSNCPFYLSSRKIHKVWREKNNIIHSLLCVYAETERVNRSWLYFVEHDISDIYMSVLAVVGLRRERERERETHTHTQRHRERERTNGNLLYFVQHDISHTCLCWLLWARAERQRQRETERKRKQMEVCYALCSMTSLIHVCVGCCGLVQRVRDSY